MELQPFGECLGVEVKGIDLDTLTETETHALRKALLEHEVLVFRDTGLDDESHLAFASRFGAPSVFPMMKMMGDTKPTFQVIRDDQESKPEADYWHTDVTWTAEPPTAAFLRATIVPETGGDTCWGSMTAAFDALSPTMQNFLEGLRVWHDNTSFIEGMLRKRASEVEQIRPVAEKLRATYPGVEHPLIRTHPETGRRAILYGGHFMRHVVDMEPLESRAILDFLAQHIDQPRFHCRWKWKLGDLAVWDERSTVHRGRGDHYPQVREVRRCVIDGDRPYYQSA